jgi:hypothetical protein
LIVQFSHGADSFSLLDATIRRRSEVSPADVIANPLKICPEFDEQAGYGDYALRTMKGLS